jgi:hypothetical protein
MANALIVISLEYYSQSLAKEQWLEHGMDSQSLANEQWLEHGMDSQSLANEQ